MIAATMRTAAVVSGFVLAAHALHAQQATKPPVPAGWTIRADDAAAKLDSLEFVDMAPGWHITTGPHVILYHPDSTAAGNFRIEAEIFLFDPGQRREGFGVFFGGRDLSGANQRYSYFLIRQDGRYIIKRRDGAQAPTVKPWTENAAIVKWSERGEGKVTAKNILAIEAGPEFVVFSVNGTAVDRLPRSQLDADGIVGLRVSHAVNLHVSRLAIQKM
jgi:hypothetical protein